MHGQTVVTILLWFACAGACTAADLGRTPGFEHYDAAAREFLAAHEIPGLSLAVSYGGRVWFAKGYGLADREEQTPVTASSRFRIASVSKPITAVAVLQLAERGRLQLDDRVWSHLPWLEADQERQPSEMDPRWKDVTIRHLLEHRGGWDRHTSFDPMFQSVRFAEQLGTPPPADARTVIRAMLAQPLDFTPGQRYAYSNFGYCLLGRIVEQTSNQRYEAYVREHVLAPLNIDMRLGATHPADRADGEVTYYHKGHKPSVFAADLDMPVPSPYGAWNLEAMDAHGGWVASAVDLARFAAAFDDPNKCPVLSPDSIRAMHTRPPGRAGWREEGTPREPYYSLGWMNRTVDGGTHHWHNGSLPGTTAILIRRKDGKNLVALLNTRQSPQSQKLASEVDRLVHRLANEVSQWPHE